MTKQQKTNIWTAVALVPTVGAIVFWLLSSAFVPHRAYNQDQRVLDQRVDTLEVRQQREASKSDRILCYLQSENNERPVSECVR